MKNLLIAFLFLISIIACKEEKIIEIPVQDKGLEGTVWTRFDHEDRGRKVYEVIEFTKDTISVNYKHDKKDVYIPVGDFEYIYSNIKKEFWTKNPGHLLIWGNIDGDEMYFGGKILIKEK